MKSVVEKVETVADIICDGCGKSCLANHENSQFEYLTLIAGWGYWSNKDGEQWDFQLCEGCSDKLLQLFPKLKDLITRCF